MLVRGAIDGFLASRKASGCTKSTYETYRRELPMLLGGVIDEKVSALQPEGLQACMAQVYDRGVSAATMKSYRLRIAALVNWCGLMGYCRDGLMRGLPKVRTSQFIRRTYTEEEFKALLEYARLRPNRYWAAMDVALLTLLMDTGIRVGEACALNVEDLGPEGKIKVRGKGNKERFVRVCARTAEALADYLRIRGAVLRTFEPLFLTDKGSRPTPGGIYRRLHRLGGRIGIPVNPHKFRHTFASQAVANGANLKALQFFLGHAQLQTTDRYLSGFGNEQALEDHAKFSPIAAMFKH
jgi:integrase/recombinase XerC/integrase/recombinase XerD